MKLAIICFTAAGKLLSLQLAPALTADVCTLFTTQKLADQTICSYGTDLTGFVGHAFTQYDGLVFIGASGIAVRAVAPHLNSKTTDPAVVVMDEKARFSISLVSGHIGCANSLALRLAHAVNATPVITTATDVNGLFSIDSWAAHHNLHIENMHVAKEISARLLHHLPVGFTTNQFTLPPLPKGFVETAAPVGAVISIYETQAPYAQTLRLVPKLVSIGIGCKKGTSAEQIESLFLHCLQKHNLSLHSIQQICSIDLKRHEPGLLQFCKNYTLPLVCYSSQQLTKAQGNFTPSAFVQAITGIDNICERACVLGAKNGTLLIPKHSANGVTFAAALQNRRFPFEY